MKLKSNDPLGDTSCSPLLFLGCFGLLAVQLSPLLLRLIAGTKMLNHRMKVRHVLSHQQTGKRITALPVGPVGRHDADKLCPVCPTGVNYRSPADTVDGDPVNQIGASVFTSSTNTSREKAQSPSFNAGVSKPTDLDTSADWGFHRTEWYQRLWKIKLAGRKEYDRRVRLLISKNNPIRF